MDGDEPGLARTIARAYRASGVAAKVQGGMLFVEREEGWDGPIEPTSAGATYIDDIRSIEGRARQAASKVVETLNETERSLMGQRSGYASLYLSDPQRFQNLGYDDRRARVYVSVVKSLSPWNEFRA